MIAPPPSFPVSRFTRSKGKLELGYRQGLEKGILFLENV
ncbi:hypothetical protein WMR86_19570 (plasmid) [Proteus vulgaris]|nr:MULTISPECIES: hypothetical protein [Proteus]MDM3591115.1 hypothetical protein [Proteus mirabilis]MDM3780874.1 hypothetical protein [Proteus mirabilis]